MLSKWSTKTKFIFCFELNQLGPDTSFSKVGVPRQEELVEGEAVLATWSSQSRMRLNVMRVGLPGLGEQKWESRNVPSQQIWPDHWTSVHESFIIDLN